MTYITEQIEKNKDITIKVLRYSEIEVNKLDISILTDKELILLKSFKSEKRQLEYFFARILWLSFNQKETIKYKKSGKPKLDFGYISISHSHFQVAIAFSETKAVGMDLEQESNKVQVIKSKYLHPSEAYNSIRELTKIWTIKEAIYKLYDSKLISFKEIFV